MSTQQDIEFHQGETWLIMFAAHNADNSAIEFDDETDIQFRISGDEGTIITQVRDRGIVVTDPDNGLCNITVTPFDQEQAGLLDVDTYLYEIRVITTQFVSIQANGKFRVRASLFAVPDSP